MAEPGQAVAARAKRGKRGVLFAAPELWLLPSPASGRVAPPSIVGDANLLSPQTRINLPVPLGPLSVSVLKAWRGRV